ncbi:hypothetical protein D3C76_1138080 [compost metagenome]
MGRTTGGIRHHRGHHRQGHAQRALVFAGRNRLGPSEERRVRVVGVPATELVGLLAHPGIALTPPGLVPAIIDPVADGPGAGLQAGQALAAGLAPQGAGKNVAVFFSRTHAFSPGNKKPARGGLKGDSQKRKRPVSAGRLLGLFGQPKRRRRTMIEQRKLARLQAMAQRLAVLLQRAVLLRCQGGGRTTFQFVTMP